MLLAAVVASTCEQAFAAEGIRGALIRQSQPASCGAAALATLINAHTEAPGYFSEADVFALLTAAGVPVPEFAAGSGFSLAQLARAADEAGFHPVAISVDKAMLDRLQRPALAFLPRPQPHFTVIHPYPERPGWLQLLDPSWGQLTLPVTVVARLWAGAGDRGVLMLLG